MRFRRQSNRCAWKTPEEEEQEEEKEKKEEKEEDEDEAEEEEEALRGQSGNGPEEKRPAE